MSSIGLFLFQELTAGLHSHFSQECDRPLEILGIDLDENLIEVANNKLKNLVSTYYLLLSQILFQNVESWRHF